MLKYVQNVTSNKLNLKVGVRTATAFTELTIGISRGGIYEIDQMMTYYNLEELITGKKLIVLDENHKVVSGSVKIVSSLDKPTEDEDILEDLESLEEENPPEDDDLGDKDLGENEENEDFPDPDNEDTPEYFESNYESEDIINDGDLLDNFEIPSLENPDPITEVTNDFVDDRGVFVCPHCRAEYATQGGLTRHMNKEHPQDVTPVL